MTSDTEVLLAVLAAALIANLLYGVLGPLPSPSGMSRQLAAYGALLAALMVAVGTLQGEAAATHVVVVHLVACLFAFLMGETSGRWRADAARRDPKPPEPADDRPD